MASAPDRAGEAVARAYDARAEEYVARFGDVAALPAEDRAVLEHWRATVSGPVLDAGCGPGHWTAFLARDGLPVLGVDLSARFLDHARRTHPGVAYVRGTLRALPLHDASVGGVLAWFSTLHTPPDELPALLAELRRPLETGGRLLLGYADGTAGEAYDHAVTTAWFTSREALTPLLAGLGLHVVAHGARREEGVRPSAWLVASA